MPHNFLIKKQSCTETPCTVVPPTEINFQDCKVFIVFSHSPFVKGRFLLTSLLEEGERSEKFPGDEEKGWIHFLPLFWSGKLKFL